MSAASSIGLISAGVIWRTLGLRTAGQALVRATSSGDDQLRTLGGMLLVQASERSIGLVQGAADSGDLNSTLIAVLGDIGGARSKEALTDIVEAGGRHAEDAATSLELLARIEELEDEE